MGKVRLCQYQLYLIPLSLILSLIPLPLILSLIPLPLKVLDFVNINVETVFVDKLRYKDLMKIEKEAKAASTHGEFQKVMASYADKDPGLGEEGKTEKTEGE